LVLSVWCSVAFACGCCLGSSRCSGGLGPCRDGALLCRHGIERAILVSLLVECGVRVAGERVGWVDLCVFGVFGVARVCGVCVGRG
jgi:hypothetical protein